MPAGKGRLRRAIEDFMQTNPATEAGIGWFEAGANRAAEFDALLLQLIREHPGTAIGHIITFALSGLAYVFFGKEWGIELLRAEAAGTPTDDLSSFIADNVAMAFNNPVVREASETIGAFVVDSVLSVLEAEATNPSDDPKEFARAFHGIMASLTLGGGVLDTTIETMTGGQIEGAGRMLQSLYWNLGLGFLGWQTMAPLLESGIKGNLTRYYSQMFRPSRFTTAELRDLFALGKISRDDMVVAAKENGWRDEDIETWINLAFRNLSESDLWKAYHEGMMSYDELMRRMRALGYNPSDLELLTKLNKPAAVVDAEAVTLATAKQSFKEQLIGEAEFRAILAELEKGEREIELQVQLIQHQQEEAIKRLTISQLQAAWDANELTDAEVSFWLTQEGYSVEQVSLLLRTWKADLEPPFRKLNKGTILGAYVEGVLDRTQAFRKLVEVGFADGDARLELDLTEARSPEAFGRPAPRLSKQLAPGTLSELLGAALIGPADMLARLVELGYEQEDAELLTAAAVLRAEGEPRPLTQLTVERAYIVGVLDRAGALAKFGELDFTPEASEQIVATVEEENPAVFNPESITALRVPSTSALVEALRSGIIDEPTFYARMTEAGYDRATSDMYLNLAVQSERKKEKTLTAAQILEAYSRDFINRAQGMSRLTSMGYGEDDATMMLRFEKSGIEDTEPWKLMLSNALSPEDAFTQLLGMGFTPDELDKAIAGLQEE